MSDTSGAPAPAPAPPPTPPAPAWYEGKLDAETIGHIDNKGWKKDDPIDVAINATKQARELQKHFGVPPDQLLKLPSKPDDEAGWNVVRQRLGMPPEAKDYDFSAVKRADGSDIDPALADALRSSLHKAGTPKDIAPEVAKSVAKVLDDQAAAVATERAARTQAERTDLMKEWGPNFEFNRLTAMQGAKRLGVSEEEVIGMQETMGYRRTMEHFHKIGAGTSEDTFVDSGRGGNPTTLNGAKARKADLEADKEWSKRYTAGGAAERREMDSLLQIITGVSA